LRKAWNAAFACYQAQYPDLSDQIERLQKRGLPDGWDASLPAFAPSVSGMSTRDASSKILITVAEQVPWLVGGAADLASSTKTRLAFEFAGDFQAGRRLGDHRGRNFHFGVRGHAMCAVNGMTLSGMRAFAPGFLIFTDYARGAIRLASIMDLPVLHVWTHHSISVGEDGPTHQPIEQILSLRGIPGMIVIRPADANEMTEAYRFILGPACRADLLATGAADRRPQSIRSRQPTGARRLYSGRRRSLVSPVVRRRPKAL